VYHFIISTYFERMRALEIVMAISTDPVENALIVVEGTKSQVELLKKEIDAQPNSESRSSERKNFDGDAAAWIVIASLSAQSLPHILNFMRDVLQINKVKRFKIGDIEIENPGTKELDELRARLASLPMGKLE
jgi:hypothetical protein